MHPDVDQKKVTFIARFLQSLPSECDPLVLGMILSKNVFTLGVVGPIKRQRRQKSGIGDALVEFMQSS
jgi:hypothetical protein